MLRWSDMKEKLERVAHAPSRAADTPAREATRRQEHRRVGARPAAVSAGVGWVGRSGGGDSSGVVRWSERWPESWPAAVTGAGVGEYDGRNIGKNWENQKRGFRDETAIKAVEIVQQ